MALFLDDTPMKLRLILAIIISLVCFSSGMGIVVLLKKMSDDATTSSSEEYEINSTVIEGDSHRDQPGKTEVTGKNKKELVETKTITQTMDPKEHKEESTKSPKISGNIGDAETNSDIKLIPEPEDIIEEDLEKKWWLGLRGRKCYVDFGSQKALVVRTGELESDQVATYSTFKKNPKVTTLRKKNNTVVRPIAFGFHHADGEPNLVYISIREDGRERLKGILSLRISGEKLKLKLRKRTRNKDKEKKKGSEK